MQFDPENKFFTFEAGAAKLSGGQGWADVWFKGHFAIEYKGPDKSLARACEQLLQYRESLQNPPLLVTSNTQEFFIHANFTNSVKRVLHVTLDDLLTPQGLQHLRNLFYNPEAFRPEPTDGPRVQAIAAAAPDLVAQHDAWLNSPGLDDKELQKRTFTNLYNARPEWLAAAHRRFDAAVCAAYGWPEDLRNEDILARLLALNLARAG